MAIMKFSSTRLNNLFSGGENGYEWDSVKNLMFDLSDGLDICDEEGNKINKKEAEAKMRNIIFSVLGLDASKKPTKRDIKRAFNRHGEEYFEVIEEHVDMNKLSIISNLLFIVIFTRATCRFIENCIRNFRNYFFKILKYFFGFKFFKHRLKDRYLLFICYMHIYRLS